MVGQQLESESNIEDEEEIMKIDPIPPYLIYDGFEKNRCSHGLRESYGQHRNIIHALACTDLSSFMNDWTMEA